MYNYLWDERPTDFALLPRMWYYSVMILKKTIFFILLTAILGLGCFNIVTAQEEPLAPPVVVVEPPVLDFFFSPTCPHCTEEEKFLDDLEKDYPALTINRYDLFDRANLETLRSFYKEYNVKDSEQGRVPANFFGTDYVIGYNDALADRLTEYAKTGIATSSNGTNPEDGNKISLPIIGEVDATKYSLPVLAIVLGFFDGFNVCSLGALVLILGLVLVLKSRKKILMFGGIFILSTAVVYGLLIVLWFKLFTILAPYLKIMQILIGLLGIGGGVYFFKEFLKFKKYGPTCEIQKSDGLMARLTAKMKSRLDKESSAILLVITILLFAAIITIVEFPCSAAVPVIFAGILSQAGLPGWQYLLYIALFILFYMLDEIIIFLIAFFTLNLKITSNKFTTWIALTEAIVLFALGLYYLFGSLIF